MTFVRRCLVHHLELDSLRCPAGHRAEQHHAGTDRLEPAFDVYDTLTGTVLWEVHGDSIRDRFERDYTTTRKVDGRDANGFAADIRARHEVWVTHEQRTRVYREKILEEVCPRCGITVERLSRHQRRSARCRGLGRS